MNLRMFAIASALAGLFSVQLHAEQQQSQPNPFEFEKPKEVPAAPVAVVNPNPDLSVSQRNQVAKMMEQAIQSMEMSLPKDSGQVDIKGEKYVVLREGDRYVGITSGMHTVYSKRTGDYTYFDSRQFKAVIMESDFKAMVGDAKSKAAELLRGMGGDQTMDDIVPDDVEPATHESFAPAGDAQVLPVPPVVNETPSTTPPSANKH